MRRATIGVVTGIAAISLLAAACGDDDTEATGGTDEPAAESNSCPVDGCEIRITEVDRSGDELVITWDANFAPDIARNHVHVYWDIFDAAQVSSDAEANGLAQGDWTPTDADPTFTTESATSVTNRGDSTTICVTAADGDHAVLDTTAIDCRDVADLVA